MFKEPGARQYGRFRSPPGLVKTRVLLGSPAITKALFAVLRSLNLILILFQVPQHFGALPASLRQLGIPGSGPHSSAFEMHGHQSHYLGDTVHVPEHTHFTFSGTVPFTRVPWSEQCNPNFCLDQLEFMYIT